MPDASIVPDVNDEFGDTNVILFCVYQQPLPGENQIREDQRYTFRELDVISEHIKDELRLLPGVAKSAEYGRATWRRSTSRPTSALGRN